MENFKNIILCKKEILGLQQRIFSLLSKSFSIPDHEIFLREMVSNAVDATQKIKTLAEKGDFKGELGDLAVRITLDEAAKTITISDNGIGTTEEEIDTYSSDCFLWRYSIPLEQYKYNANAIIGHFGLGF